MDFFTLGLTLSLGVFAGGLVYRVAGWLRHSVLQPGPNAGERLASCFDGMFRTFNGRRVAAVLLSLIRDALPQLHLLRAGRSGLVRWIMHFLIFAGFVGLLFMHAMDGVFSYRFLPDYEPTLDPYQLLRNVFGVMVLAGVALAACRRLLDHELRRVTGPGDWLALALVGGVVLSGFLLEAVKIQSPAMFQTMVETYYPAADEGEIPALKAYWAKENGVVFTNLKDPKPELVERGAEVHDIACASCHDPTASAFVSRGLALALTPAAPLLREVQGHRLFWYVHLLFVFGGLTWLPFGKMLHVVMTPLNLLVRPYDPRPERRPASLDRDEVLRGLGLDACTHCGECSRHCSVSPIHLAMRNLDILPSEKLASLRQVVDGHEPAHGLASFAEGSFICTECHRCTEVCPARINLQDLWLASKAELARREQVEPHGLIVRRTASEWAAVFRDRIAREPDPPRTVNLVDRRESFWGCIQCTTCTSVCPVVAAADDPQRELDLTPQQIMNLMRMGMKDLALGSRMVWSCVTCYKCQENCPQGVKVADVLYELRNIAAQRLRLENGANERRGRREDAA